MIQLFLALWLSILLPGFALAVDLRATWIDNADNEDGYRLEVCSGDCSKTGTWTVFATTAPNVTTIFPVTVTVFPVSFRVLGFNFLGNSDLSNIVVLRTPNATTLSFTVGP